MKKILVIYYSQTGQLKDIIHSVLTTVAGHSDISIDYEELKPKTPYPFPWTTFEFCNAFPESVAEAPCELAPLQMDPEAQYDLIILAYTVWYLSPSIPVTAFLQSADAQRLLCNRPVLTLIGCRNMWLTAQEKVKRAIYRIGGHVAGNIVLADRTGNLLGVVTIAAWMLSGKKKRFMGIFPQPGISDEDIRASSRFGESIVNALRQDEFALDQDRLNRAGAVRVFPTFIIFEKRMHKIFKIWSAFIRAKGGPEAPERRIRVRMFFYYLLLAIVLLAPIATVFSGLAMLLKRRRLQKEMAYFLQNSIRDP